MERLHSRHERHPPSLGMSSSVVSQRTISEGNTEGIQFALERGVRCGSHDISQQGELGRRCSYGLDELFSTQFRLTHGLLERAGLLDPPPRDDLGYTFVRNRNAAAAGTPKPGSTAATAAAKAAKVLSRAMRLRFFFDTGEGKPRQVFFHVALPGWREHGYRARA